MEKKKLVLFGGASYEHEISVISAVQAMMNNEDLVPVYISQSGEWYIGDNLKKLDCYANMGYLKNKEVTILPNSKILYLKRRKKYIPLYEIECVVCIFHGGFMEGGGVAGLLELAGIPYTQSGIAGSSIVQSKTMCELVLQGMDIERLPFLIVKEKDFFVETKMITDYIEENIQFPCIIKPSNLGSSIGIGVVFSKNELSQKLATAFEYDDEVLVQKYLEKKKEINIAMFEKQGKLIVSNLEQPMSQSEILTFAEKYQNGNKEGMAGLIRNLAPKLTKKQEQYIKNTAQKIYKTLNLFGVVRMDFLIDLESQNVYLNEINNIPGSLAYYLFEEEYGELLNIYIKEGLRRCVSKRVINVPFVVLKNMENNGLSKLNK